MKAFGFFKSHISEEVYQTQISTISMEKSCSQSQNLSASVKGTEVPRKICFNQDSIISNPDKTQEMSVEYFDQQLLEYTGLKSDLDKNSYRRSLISQRTHSVRDRPISTRLSFLSSVMKENPENLKKASLSLKAYQEIIETLEKHLKDPLNALGFLFREFIKHSTEYCRENIKLQKDEKDGKECLREFYEFFTADVKNFLEILQETMCLYYNIEHLAEAFPDFVFFTKENLINFLFNIFFQSDVYEVLLELETLVSDFADEKIMKSVKSLEGLTLRDFSIPPALINPKREPFKESIDILQGLNHFRSPLQKMKLIVKVSDSFIKEISEISREVITGDDTLLIFFYIVTKAKVEKIFSQLSLIERFSGRGLLMARSGYYFATLQICVSHLQEENTREMMLKQEMMDSLKRASECISWGKGNLC